VQGATIRLRFRGKGGRTEERMIIDRRLAAVVRRCQDLPGQELFQYEDETAEPHPIGSDDVNGYIREAADDPAFSAKDFRTWTATVHAYRALRAGASEAAATSARGRSRLNEALRRTAETLGNTLAVTRASYVHPGVVAAFDGDAAEATTGSRRPDSLDTPATRDDELELLRLLRHAERARGPARRSKPKARRVARQARHSRT
jgi:DNA topoisomerase-1